jgi:hypothetical protein
MNGKPKPLKNYLQNCTEFATILANMQQNSSILELVQGLLPPPLNEHCVGLVAKNDQLILFASSSAWASRMRFLSPELITKLKNNNIYINKISVKVMVDLLERKSHPKHGGAQPLSTKSADLVQRVADHTPDPDLQAALRRLSSHRKNRE